MRFAITFIALLGMFIVGLIPTGLMLMGWIIHPLWSVVGFALTNVWAYAFVLAMNRLIEWSIE